MIVSPDSLYVPVLAYSPQGNFSVAEKDLNTGLLMRMNKHAHELDYVRCNKSHYIDSIGRVNRALWAGQGATDINANPLAHTGIHAKGVTGPVTNVLPPTLISSVPTTNTVEVKVGPLCPTIWGQQNPWQAQCPMYTNSTGSGLCVVGCTPVAMAQVMYFWGIKYPASLPNYNWASMPLDGYHGGMLPATNDCFRLLHDIGTTHAPHGQFVSYGALESSANDEDIQAVFNTFGFSGVQYAGDYSRVQYFSGPQDDNYGTLITNEVQNNKRPCIISGFTDENDILGVFSVSGSGHTWVCDGSDVTTYSMGTLNTYKTFYGVIYTQTLYTSQIVTSYVHMNWGYDGLNDLWYNADVNYTQQTSSAENFKYFQLIDYNISLN